MTCKISLQTEGGREFWEIFSSQKIWSFMRKKSPAILSSCLKNGIGEGRCCLEHSNHIRLRDDKVKGCGGRNYKIETIVAPGLNTSVLSLKHSMVSHLAPWKRQSLMACKTQVKCAGPSISPPRLLTSFFCSRHTAHLTVPRMCQARICIRAFASAVPIAWSTFASQVCKMLPHLLQASAPRSPSHTQSCLLGPQLLCPLASCHSAWKTKTKINKP